MDSGLELEAAEGAATVDLDDCLADTADAVLIGVEHFGRHAVPLRIAQVHAQHFSREELGLVTAGSGADLEDHVLLVVRVGRQKLDAQVVDQLGLLRLKGAHFLLGHFVHLGIAGIAHLERLGQLLSSIEELAPCLHDRLDLGDLLAQFLEGSWVLRSLGSRQLHLNRVVLGGDLDELGVDHDAASAESGASPSAVSAERGLLGMTALPAGISSPSASSAR